MHTNAGTHHDTWTFTDPNYVSQAGTVTDVIAPANASAVVHPYVATYNGIAQPPVGTVTGVNGTLPSGDLVLSTTHTNAGTYNDTWAFSDPRGNYLSAHGMVTDTINQGRAAVVVTPYTVIYNGQSHTTTGVATGDHGDNLPSSDLNVTATTHTNAGTYNDAWTFTDPNGNYMAISGTVTDTILKANASINVVGYNTFYNATPQAATGTAYGLNGTVLPGLNLGCTTHTSVGTYTDTWTFTDTTGNYNNASGVVTDTITPSKSKMVRETVLVPETIKVRVTELVPVLKEFRVVERVKVGNKWVKKTVLVPETVLVRKTVLVNETKMVKETEIVKVYYS